MLTESEQIIVASPDRRVAVVSNPVNKRVSIVFFHPEIVGPVWWVNPDLYEGTFAAQKVEAVKASGVRISVDELQKLITAQSQVVDGNSRVVTYLPPLRPYSEVGFSR